MSELYIETHGSGAAHVVLLHGWAMHGGAFAPLTEVLAWQAMQWSAEASGGTFTCIEHAGHAPFIGFADAVAAAIAPLLQPTTSDRKRA